jgi:AcrR family transcriptional regulator
MSKGAQTRERILERAYRLASRDGLEGLSLSTLAAETGLSKSGLFAHFRSKEELQIEVLRQAAERFEQVVWAPAARAPRGEARLRKLFDGWLRWLDDPTSPGGCIFGAASVELDDREGRPRDFLVETQERLLASIAKTARLGIESGDLRRDLDCEQLAFDLYGLVLSYNHYKRLLRDPRARDRAERAFERLVTSARRSS